MLQLTVTPKAKVALLEKRPWAILQLPWQDQGRLAYGIY